MIEGTTSRLRLIEERKESTILGAVAFIFDPQNRLLVIKEKEGKEETKRNSGEYGVPCESRNTDIKEGWAGNVLRCLSEELGLPRNRFSDVFDFRDCTIWETGFVAGVWATVVRIQCKKPELLLEVAKGSDEIEIIGWKTREEFQALKPIREGVVRILDRFKEDSLFGK